MVLLFFTKVLDHTFQLIFQKPIVCELDIISQESVYVSLEPMPLLEEIVPGTFRLESSDSGSNDSLNFIPELDDIEADLADSADELAQVVQETDAIVQEIEESEVYFPSQYRQYLESKRASKKQSVAKRTGQTEEIRQELLTRDRLWHQGTQNQVVEDQTRPGRRRKVNILEKGAWDYDVTSFNLHHHKIFVIGAMNVVCEFCQALRFPGEPKGICCKSNTVNDVPKIPPPPEEMMPLFSLNSASKQFLANARKYNQAFQMTSIKTSWIVEDGFMPTVKIQGQLSHRMGSLLPADGDEPKFLQIYFIGNPEAEANRREMIADGVWNSTIKVIQEVLHEKNEYIQRFKYLLEHDENINDQGAHVVIRADRFTNAHHRGVLNAPQHEDFAAVVSDERLAGLANRDIKVQTKGGPFFTISEKHRSYDPLQYPVILWNGQDGWDVEKKVRKLTTTTSCQWYAYQLMQREGDFNTLLKLGKLFSQFAVDMYAKIESERLGFQAKNQKQLRAESYKGYHDSLENDMPLDKTGIPVILSPSFVGGPRYMHSKTQDALTYVRVHGRPSLFITMTCSTKWLEIQRELYPGQKTEDREDIIARVFNQRRTTMIKAIKDGLFGPLRCYMLSIEWQKRGKMGF